MFEESEWIRCGTNLRHAARPSFIPNCPVLETAETPRRESKIRVVSTVEMASLALNLASPLTGRDWWLMGLSTCRSKHCGSNTTSCVLYRLDLQVRPRKRDASVGSLRHEVNYE